MKMKLACAVFCMSVATEKVLARNKPSSHAGYKRPSAFKKQQVSYPGNNPFIFSCSTHSGRSGFHEARRSQEIACFLNSSKWPLTRLEKHFKQQTEPDRKTIEQTLALRILVLSSKETTSSGDERVGCVGVGRLEAFVSATQAEYTPPPHPPPTCYCRSTESNLLDETITMGCNYFLNQPSNSVEWLSRIHSLQHIPPSSLHALLSAPSCRFHVAAFIQSQVLRCKGKELEVCFSIDVAACEKVARDMTESKKREPHNFLLFFESQSLI